MQNPDHFHQSINTLVKAYFNNTLIHGECSSCAVGNIIAANMNIKLLRRHELKNTNWTEDVTLCPVFFWDESGYSPGGDSWGAINTNEPLTERGRAEIAASGYSIEELIKMERAFEGVKEEEGNGNYNGLMAVVEVLCEIHQVSEQTKQDTKALFDK